MKRRVVFNLFFLAVVVAVGLAAMEWGVRFLAPQKLVRGYNVPDADLGTYVAPNMRYRDHYSQGGPYEVRTNGHGFRMDEEVNMSEARKRVLVYGDSFTFGWGLDIEHTYFRRLKTAAESANSVVQLLNAGVGGYSSGHVKILMERHLPAIKPAAIIYFFNNNDLVDNAITDIDYRVSTLTFGDDGEPALVDVQPFMPWKKFALLHTPYPWLNKNSHLFVLAKEQVKRAVNWKRHIQVPAVEIALPPAEPGVERPVGASALTGSTTPVFDPRLARFVYISELHVLRITGLAKAAGVPLLMVWVPAPHEMFPPPTRSSTLRLLTLGRDMLRRVATERSGVEFVDTVSRIPRSADWMARRGTMRLADGHFNAAGNAWYAELVRPAVLDFLSVVGNR